MEIKKDINNIIDKSYKDFLSKKEVFAEMISTFIEASWAKEIKAEDLILINKEFILSDYEELESDIVYRVNDGKKDIYFYVLMELQSTVDFSMPLRLFLYISEIYRDIIKNIDKKSIKSKGFRLPAVIPIVLYNGEYNWTAARNFKDIVYNSNTYGNNIINFEYLLLDVNRYSKDNLRKIGNLSAAIFMLDQKVNSLEFLNRITEVALDFDRLSEENKMLLKHWLRNILNEDFKEKFKVDDILNASKEEVFNMTSNISKTLKEEFDRAKTEGMQKGIEEGIEKGKIDLLIKQLNKKFTEFPTSYVNRLKELTEDKIEDIGENIFDINTLEELDKYLN